MFLGVLLGAVFFSFVNPGGGEYIPPGPKFKCPLVQQIWPCICHSPSDDGISLNCKDVSLATLSAALAYPISTNVPINFLNISGLNAAILFGPLFQGTNATKLRIQDSPRVKNILSDVFLPLRDSLKELSIVSTSLVEFPYSAVQELNNLESLEIDRHLISNVSLPIEGMPKLKALALTNGKISTLSKATFPPVSGKLSRLDLHGNQLVGFPKDTLSSLKSLEYLDVAFNNFTKLEPQDFFQLSKLTWFNGSSNHIPSFQRGAFARNGFLRVIVLNNNKIGKLEAAAFRGMRLLVRLYLRENQIADVGRGAFGSLQRIKTIDLSGNLLKEVDFQMFQKLPFCEELFLDRNNITVIKSGAFNELTQVHINLADNSIAKVEKDAFVNCVNITLDMSNNKIDNFTKGAFDEVSYADEWRLQGNLLERTQDIPLKFMTGIRILNISNCKLKEVGKNTFPKLYELHTVDLSRNQISKIHPSVFTTLFGLRWLDLSHNNLSEIQGSTFGAIPTLLELRLDHNRLRSASNAAFNKLVSLRQLFLSYNNLTKVPGISGSLNALDISFNKISSLVNAWPDMNSLQVLNLSRNQLMDSLDSNSFKSLGALSRLNLSSNGIGNAPKDALSPLTSCQYIDLSHNKITSLEKAAFGRLPVVFELLLNNNEIANISEQAFQGLLQLINLDLSNNQLAIVKNGALANLVSLRNLSLANNSISRTENGTNSLFEDNLSLTDLDLSFNAIQNIHPLTFPQQEWTNYKLSKVDLTGNKISILSREMLRGSRNLEVLILANNSIQDIKPGVLSSFGFLKSIDLSFNRIHSLESFSKPPPVLEEILLRGNLLRRWNYRFLKELKNLTRIDLRENKLRNFPENDLLPLIRDNGSLVQTNGNPMDCDCNFIGLQRYLSQERKELSNRSREFFENLEGIKCLLHGQEWSLLSRVDERELACSEDDPLAEKRVIEKDKEVGIRTLVQKGAEAEVKWRVLKSKADVSGFLVGMREEDGEIVGEKLFSYRERSGRVELKKGAVEVCVRARRSEEMGQVKRGWGESEVSCQIVDGSLIGGGNGGGGSSGATGRSGRSSVAMGLVVLIGLMISG